MTTYNTDIKVTITFEDKDLKDSVAQTAFLISLKNNLSVSEAFRAYDKHDVKMKLFEILHREIINDVDRQQLAKEEAHIIFENLKKHIDEYTNR
jgi:hypothetical protein